MPSSHWVFALRSSWSLSSCVSADKTITEKHPGAVGNASWGGYDQRGLTTYGALENWLSGWLDWKLQVTEVELLTTSLDLKVHRRVPVVPFCIITSGSACMSIADVGFVTVNEWGNKIRLLVLAKKTWHIWASVRPRLKSGVCCVPTSATMLIS